MKSDRHFYTRARVVALPFVQSILAVPLAQTFHISHFLTLGLAIALWMLLLWRESWRIEREVRIEKLALQARHDEEDAQIFSSESKNL